MSAFVQGCDAPLSYHWHAPEDAIERLSMYVAKARDTRASDASILAAALIEHDGQNRFISYSRSADMWAAGIFEGTTYSKRRVVPLVDKLDELGWIEHDKAPPQPLGVDPDEDLTQRWQSRFRATDRMADKLRGIRLQHRGPSSPIILRDDNGMALALPKTDRVHRLRRGVDEVNAALAGLRVTVSPEADPANWRRSEYHLHARKVRGDGSETWACTLPTPDPHVVRIFSRSSFDLHGRLYGWWQGLPKARRAELLINDEILCEPDFRWLHPTLIYAMCGHSIAHDPYTTGYWPRQAGKVAFNTYLNAPTDVEAIGGLLKKRHEKDDNGEPAWRYGRRQTARILAAIKDANPRIAHMFGSDAGVRLMTIDSTMAMKVMKACRKEHIPCLPVHDSFMVPASRGVTVEGIMGAVLDETLAAVKSKVSMGSAKTYRHNAPLSPGVPSTEGVEALSPEGKVAPVPARETLPPGSVGASPREGMGDLPSVGEVLPAWPWGASSLEGGGSLPSVGAGTSLPPGSLPLRSLGTSRAWREDLPSRENLPPRPVPRPCRRNGPPRPDLGPWRIRDRGRIVTGDRGLLALRVAELSALGIDCLALPE